MIMLMMTHDGEYDTHFLLASVWVEEVMSVRLAGMVDSGHCGEDPHLVVAP